MIRKIILCGVILTFFAGCSDKNEKETPPPHNQINYDGPVVCPRCEKDLDKNIFEQPGQLVECPACKGKAPRGAFCRDLKNQ